MITKSIRFAAPYRSSTFNSDKALAQGLNGVVTGGKVSTSGGVVTIQPLTFVQQGQFNTCTDALSAALPPSITAPYFVAVTTSTTVQSPAEVITPTFVKRPEDVSTGTVLVAEWDGQEWRALPKLQLAEIMAADRDRAVSEDMVGVNTGFDASSDGTNLTLEPGSLTDRQGFVIKKTQPTVFPLIGDDASGGDRVDYLVYRKADDSSARVGTIQLVPGTLYDASSNFTTYVTSTITAGSIPNGLAKSLFSSANITYVLYIEDYASRSKLIFRTLSDDMLTVGSPVTVSTVLNSFDAIVNPVGSIDIVYARGNSVYYRRVDGAGASIYAERLIATTANPARNPKIVSIKSSNTYFLHVVYEQVVSGSESRLNYVRLSSSNTTETPTQSLVNLSSVITHATLEKDDDDALLLLAYENQTTGRVYLRTMDASTATNAAIPSNVGGVLELQNDTQIVSSNITAPVSGASYPIVKRGLNKDIYVFWLHNKGSANGLAVYNPRYKDAFGHKAIIVDLLSPSDNISLYGVALDGMGIAHITFEETGQARSSSFDTYTAELTRSNGVLSVSGASALDVAINKKGGLIHTYVDIPGGASNNGTAKSVAYFGAGSFLGAETISASEFVLTSADYAALPSAPTTGDTITITAASANNGTYNWVSVRSFTVLGTPYVAITTNNPAFDNSVPSGSAQFLISGAAVGKIVKTTGAARDNLRSFEVSPTDIYLARYRTSDQVVAVASPALEETVALTRVYEFLNSFVGGGGSVSWNKNADGKLSFGNPFTVNFFNRVSTVSVNAIPGGIVIGANQVAYVDIPDDDSAATVNLKVVDFGSGILDRHGKDVLTLFWNIGGTLYTKFFPFALSSGETVVLGKDVGELIASQMKIVEHPTNKKRVIVTPADVTMPDGSVLAQVAANMDARFLGAVIDFQTGIIYEADGSTPTGQTFTPIIPVLNQFRWFSITALPGTTTADNRVNLLLTVLPGSADGGSPFGTAPRAPYAGGKPIGQLYVFNPASAIGDITQVAIRQVGPGSGGGDLFATEVGINNNQIAPLNVDRFVVDPSRFRGFLSEYSLYRFHANSEADGALDADFLSTFVDANIGSVSVQSLTELSDRSVIVGGIFSGGNFIGNAGCVFKLDVFGNLDTAFDANLGLGANQPILATAVQPDGKILLGGRFTSFNGSAAVRLIRLNTDGTEDTAFTANLGTGFNNEVLVIKVQADGKILVGGRASLFNGGPYGKFIRLNADGTEDTAFTTNLGTGFGGAGISFSIDCLAIQPDGKIVVGGAYSTLNGNSREGITRLNSDGTEDATFATNIGTGQDGTVSTIALYPNGKIFLGGSFTTFNGLARAMFVRLNANGTEDATFYTSLSPSLMGSVIFGSYLQPNGKLAIAGAFSTPAGNIARLNTNDTIDTAFSTAVGAGTDGTIYTLIGRDIGSLWFGGVFTTYDLVPHRALLAMGPPSTELHFQGSLRGAKRVKSTSWELGGEAGVGDDCGVDFSMNAAGELKYVSTDISTTPLLVSTMRYTIQKF